MTIMTRFKKKLGSLDGEWNEFVIPENLSDQVRLKVEREANLKLKDFVIFVMNSMQSWYGIHLEGVLVYSDGGFQFWAFKEFRTWSLITDEKNSANNFKESILRINVLTNDGATFS